MIAVFIVVLCFGQIGCSKSQSLNKVEGKVLHKGKPLAGALVVLHPEASGVTQQTATALSSQDGSFSLSTGQVEGVAPGSYTVTVTCPVPVKTESGGGMAMGGPVDTEDSLKGAYANRETSQIKVTIKDGPNQLEPFDLK
jgi:hypothetical protein